MIGVANRGGVISHGLEGGADRGAGDGLRPGLGAAQPAARRARSGGRRADAMAARCTTCGCRRWTIRSPTARKRSGKRVLAVGTDCSVGKMYTALAMDAEMRERGMKSDLPRHRPDRHPDHRRRRAAGCGDRRFHGRVDRMADARQRSRSLGHDRGAGQPVPRLLFRGDAGADPWRPARCADPEPRADAHPHARAARTTSCRASRRCAIPRCRWRGSPIPACQVVGVSVNTQHLGEDEALSCLAEIEARMGLPAVDPFRQGAGGWWMRWRRSDRRTGEGRCPSRSPEYFQQEERAGDADRGSAGRVQAGAGLHHQPRLADRGAGADRADRGRRRIGAGANACPMRAMARRWTASRRRSRRCRGDLDRDRLADLLPAGAARNAVDCALWDLEAKRAGKRVWELAGTGRAGAARSPPIPCRWTRPRRCGRRRRRTPIGRS